MLDDTAKNKPLTSISERAIPDPWDEDPPGGTKSPRPIWQFPLDPNHEITSAPAPNGILSPQGDPTIRQIPAHISHPQPTAIEVLLQDEMKVKAPQAQNLWNHIRDWLTLLGWSSFQDEGSKIKS